MCRTLVRCTVVADCWSSASFAGESVASAGRLLGFRSVRLASDMAEQTFR